jgi:hypothetical protein
VPLLSLHICRAISGASSSVSNRSRSGVYGIPRGDVLALVPRCPDAEHRPAPRQHVQLPRGHRSMRLAATLHADPVVKMPTGRGLCWVPAVTTSVSRSGMLGRDWIGLGDQPATKITD